MRLMGDPYRELAILWHWKFASPNTFFVIPPGGNYPTLRSLRRFNIIASMIWSPRGGLDCGRHVFAPTVPSEEDVIRFQQLFSSPHTSAPRTSPLAPSLIHGDTMADFAP
jgi:hypothetical protein